MRIIENNYQNPNQEYEITCPHCKSKLSYTYDDVISDKSDNEWIYCEACHEQIIICDNEKTLTVDIVQYPQDFYSFENGVPIKDTVTMPRVKSRCRRKTVLRLPVPMRSGTRRRISGNTLGRIFRFTTQMGSPSPIPCRKEACRPRTHRLLHRRMPRDRRWLPTQS